MTIKTKYKIGDEVWVHVDNSLQIARIDRVRTEVENVYFPRVYYDFFKIHEGIFMFSMEESKVFKTKKSLIKTL